MTISPLQREAIDAIGGEDAEDEPHLVHEMRFLYQARYLFGPGQIPGERLLAIDGDAVFDATLHDLVVGERRRADPGGIDARKRLVEVICRYTVAMGLEHSPRPVDVGVARGDHRGVDESPADDRPDRKRMDGPYEPATDDRKSSQGSDGTGSASGPQ